MDSDDGGPCGLKISPDLQLRIEHWRERTGQSEEEIVDLALRRLMRNDEEGNAVFLSAPINALVEGIYRENTTVAELRHHGDFGLGTFNDLDGEMVIVDGEIRQLRADGVAYTVADDVETPFACVTFYAPDTEEEVEGHFSWPEVDQLILGGGMANTFLGAAGVDVGASLCEADMAETARAIMRDAAAAGVEIVLPHDAVVASALEVGVATRTVAIAEVPADAMILDVGPATSDALIQRLGSLKTVVWNGPLGAFEVPPFDAGTNAVARAAAELTAAGRLLSVAGGGDTVSALAHAGVEDGFSYVSTAGGAFLKWLEGRELPGVAVLKPLR